MTSLLIFLSGFVTGAAVVAGLAIWALKDDVP